jgi:hypothetical protein
VTRTLSLRSERLSELSDADLALVLGGQTLTGLYPTGPIPGCVENLVTRLTGQ